MSARAPRRRLALLVLLAAACARSEPSAAPTLLLVTFDALAPGHLAPPGAADDVPEAGSLAALAAFAAERGAVWLRDHVAASSGTNAALASILTGRLPESHGVTTLHRLGRTRLPAGELTLAARLGEAGWRTLGFGALGSLAAPISGFERGFDVWDAPGEEQRFRARSAAEVVERAAPALAAAFASGEPVFAWLHFADLRLAAPALPPDGERCRDVLAFHLERFAGDPDFGAALAAELARAATEPAAAWSELGRLLGGRRGLPEKAAFERAREDLAVAAMDAACARVLALVDASGRGERAIVVAAAARGLARPSSQEPAAEGAHAALAARAPCLIARGGARRAPRVLEGLTRSIDLAPTALELAGLAPAEARPASNGTSPAFDGAGSASDGAGSAFDGASFAAALEDGALEPRLGRFRSNEARADFVLDEVAVWRLEPQGPIAAGEPAQRALAFAGRRDGAPSAELAPRAALPAEWRAVRTSGYRIALGPSAVGELRARAEAFGAELEPALAKSSATLAPAAGQAELLLAWRGERPALALSVSGDPALDLERIALAGSARLPPRFALSARAPWPSGADGAPEPCDLDVRQGAGRRLLVALGERTPGAAAELLVLAWGSDGPAALSVRASTAEIAAVDGQPHLVLARGTAPLEVELAKPPGAELAFAAVLAGRALPASAMRYLGECLALAGQAGVCVPAHCPGWLLDAGGEPAAGGPLELAAFGAQARADGWATLAPSAQAFVDALEPRE